MRLWNRAATTSTIPCSNDASFKALHFTSRPLCAAITLDSIVQASGRYCMQKASIASIAATSQGTIRRWADKGAARAGWLVLVLDRCRSENAVVRGVS